MREINALVRKSELIQVEGIKKGRKIQNNISGSTKKGTYQLKK